MEKMKGKFVPTPEMVSACRAVLVTKAWVETVRPIVEGYEREILDIYQFKVDKKSRGMYGEIITEPKQAWLMSDKDFVKYDAECKKERDKAGLKVENDEACPLLVAEDNLRKANALLVSAMESLTGVLPNELFAHGGVQSYDKYIALSMRLIVSVIGDEELKLKGVM